MPSKKYAFHDGKSGAALAIRVTPRSSSNQVDEILNNGTIRVRLIASGNDVKSTGFMHLGDVLNSHQN
jgi:uncharacterized protein YggU (UPF0235/DUF167 family)